ncbi:hybrid sensor histidine kinase/response regulator [Haloplanus halobius]|uniref:hybrid sensor histidine kinase/response regulator n=1 Tax=Haloplanus halobius TaxID=2934938 RepID=UPI00200C773B|nr:PAS domain S-box protein [Haloplanus sp. XH21]
MTDGTATSHDAPGSVRVLHVDDDPDFAELAATLLERADDRIAVEVATSAREGLSRLAADDVDCVVSDYDMPGMDGIAFLEAVRAEYPDLPFVLFTGKGSEEVASEAFSAGATDYLRKGSGTERYELLANRVRNAVEAHRSRRMLRERTRRLETLISNLPGVVYRCRNDPGWPMETVEGEVEAITGYTAAELARGDVTWGEEVLHPDDREPIWETVQNELDADGTFEVTYRIHTRDGATKWMWERGRGVFEDDDADEPVALEGFITDITDRKEREQELERRTEELEALTTRLEEQYRYLFEESPVMAVVTRVDDGRPIVEDCNRRFVETLGYERDAVVGEELAQFYTADSRRQLLQEGGYERALSGEFLREDRELMTADGETVEALLRAVPRHDAGDEIVGTLALYVDVSERKELEREKERLQEFASIVSHDLRNPLNVAQGCTELAREDCESEHLDTAIDAHERMGALIEDLLTLARSGDDIDELVSVDLAPLVEDCWTNAVTDDATLVVETERAIRADRSRLRQLVENLVVNSVEHGSTGSRMESDDAIEHGGDDVTVTIGELDDGFYVADDGPGIPESMRDDVFDAGYSMSDEGTGFGLRIVEQVADAHGWTISVTDSADDGARFEIRGVEFLS